MSRDKLNEQQICQATPTAADLCNEFEYTEKDLDPRDAMRAAYKYTPSQQDKDNAEKNYNDLFLIREGAESGEILSPEARKNASNAGVLKEYEMGTLKTAYELNAMGKLSQKEAREVVETETNLAAKYGKKTPLTSYTEMVQNSDKTREI